MGVADKGSLGFRTTVLQFVVALIAGPNLNRALNGIVGDGNW